MTARDDWLAGLDRIERRRIEALCHEYAEVVIDGFDDARLKAYRGVIAHVLMGFAYELVTGEAL